MATGGPYGALGILAGGMAGASEAEAERRKRMEADRAFNLQEQTAFVDNPDMLDAFFHDMLGPERYAESKATGKSWGRVPTNVISQWQLSNIARNRSRLPLKNTVAPAAPGATTPGTATAPAPPAAGIPFPDWDRMRANFGTSKNPSNALRTPQGSPLVHPNDPSSYLIAQQGTMVPRMLGQGFDERPGQVPRPMAGAAAGAAMGAQPPMVGGGIGGVVGKPPEMVDITDPSMHDYRARLVDEMMQNPQYAGMVAARAKEIERQHAVTTSDAQARGATSTVGGYKIRSFLGPIPEEAMAVLSTVDVAQAMLTSEGRAGLSGIADYMRNVPMMVETPTGEVTMMTWEELTKAQNQITVDTTINGTRFRGTYDPQTALALTTAAEQNTKHEFDIPPNLWPYAKYFGAGVSVGGKKFLGTRAEFTAGLGAASQAWNTAEDNAISRTNAATARMQANAAVGRSGGGTGNRLTDAQRAVTALEPRLRMVMSLLANPSTREKDKPDLVKQRDTILAQLNPYYAIIFPTGSKAMQYPAATTMLRATSFSESDLKSLPKTAALVDMMQKGGLIYRGRSFDGSAFTPDEHTADDPHGLKTVVALALQTALSMSDNEPTLNDTNKYTSASQMAQAKAKYVDATASALVTSFLHARGGQGPKAAEAAKNGPHGSFADGSSYGYFFNDHVDWVYGTKTPNSPGTMRNPVPARDVAGQGYNPNGD